MCGKRSSLPNVNDVAVTITFGCSTWSRVHLRKVFASGGMKSHEITKNHLSKVLFTDRYGPADVFVLTLRLWLSSIVDFLEKVKNMLEIWVAFLTNLTKCWKNITSIEIFTRNEYFNLFYNMKSEKWTNPQSHQILLLKQSRSRIVGPVRIRNRWQDEMAEWWR